MDLLLNFIRAREKKQETVRVALIEKGHTFNPSPRSVKGLRYFLGH